MFFVEFVAVRFSEGSYKLLQAALNRKVLTFIADIKRAGLIASAYTIQNGRCIYTDLGKTDETVNPRLFSAKAAYVATYFV
jgi:hypothetical protein